LEAVEFERNLDYDFDVQSVYSLNTGYEIKVPEDDPQVATIRVFVDVDWSLPDGAVSPTGFDGPFELDVTMGGLFRWPESRPIDFRREWTEYNGMYLVWPYLRAQVASLISASDLPRFTLPTLAVPRSEQWQTEEGSGAERPLPSDQPAG
jgi:hypothetical protein